MLILGIETSCDETSAAIVRETDGVWSIGSNIVASQTNIHREWGGVVPELASRQHIRDICGVVRAALDAAHVELNDADAIAVTQGPGLVGSLLVGVSFAKSLALSLNRPLVRRTSPGRPHRIPVSSARRASAAARGTRRVRRPYQSLLDPRAGHISPHRAHEGRCGRGGVRQGREIARPGISGRSDCGQARPGGRRPGGGVADDADDACRSECAGNEGRSGFQLQRLEDGSAAPRQAAYGSRRTAHRTRRSTTFARAFSAWSSRLCWIAFSRPRNDMARGALASPAAFRQTPDSGAMSQQRGERMGIPAYVPHISLSTDNAAMIAAAGLRNFHAGKTRGNGFERGREFGV